MQKLWQKKYSLGQEAEEYCFGDTVVLDNKLIKYDVLGSIAHAQMLAKIGLITSAEFGQLKKCLLEIIALQKAREFEVKFGDEDVHTKIENHLIDKLGIPGKKIHTGRSRNDQVLVDLRLYTKENLFVMAEESIKLIEAFLNFAKQHEFVPMPGYTHMQKGMPSSIGLWAASFAEGLLDDLELLKAAFKHNDQSPLGSAAAYGVPLPLDRELSAQLLGFSKVQNNSLYAQVSRGKSHLSVMAALSQIMLTLSRFAQDLLLFTTSEFNFFTIDERLCTGSSIMPQKKNLDIMEVLRARSHIVIAHQQAVASVIAGLPSGYNTDFGETKDPFMRSIEIATASLQLCNLVIKSLKPNTKVLEQACTKELYATHAAYKLVENGLPFREAYQKVGLSTNVLWTLDKIQTLKISKHSGATGNLGLSKTKAQKKVAQKWWQEKQAFYIQSINNLKEVI